MATVRSLDELNNLGRDLKNNDRVIFYKKTERQEDIYYIVQKTYLRAQGRQESNIIFGRLNRRKGVEKIDKIALATECYGYAPPNKTYWPEYRKSDYAAATKLVRRLYELYEGKTTIKEIVEEDMILSRFDIMDL